MLSFNAQYVYCQKMSGDYDTVTSLPFFKEQINVGLHIVEAELGSYYTEDTWTDSTVAQTSSYQTPPRFVRAKEVYVTVSGTQYPMQEIYEEDEWRAIQANTQTSYSNIPIYFFVRRDTYEIFPTPSSSSNTITMIYEASNKDLYNADETTGTITTLANGATSVTGSGTAFTSAMVGRFFKIDAFPEWYEISAYSSATAITLKKKYQGVSISAGSSTYTIGEMPRTPSSTHRLGPIYALSQYYLGFKENTTKATEYRKMWEDGLKMAKATYGRRYSTTYIPGKKKRLRNPNFFPQGIT